MRRRGVFIITVFIFHSILCLSLFPSPSYAAEAEKETVIRADMLKYFSAERKYECRGAVTVDRDGTHVEADEMTYYEETSEMHASGHVRYDDGETLIKAEKADLNLDAKTGKLYDADVFYRVANYHLSGHEIERRGEDYYYSDRASFTTCDAPVPAWCFKGKDVDARVGEKVKTRDATFLVKDLPVFYTPLLYASILTERQTGFLMPVAGNSNTRGIEVSIPFFWAISENRDATFVVNEYSKRGVGTGAEYRFVDPGGVSGNLWLYHIRDNELSKDFWETRGLYENRHPDSLSAYLNLNYVNESDFYREYSPYRDVRIQRFLETTGEINEPFSNSRLYLMPQYWVDLQYPTGQVPQKLPEAGYVINYTRAGSFLYALNTTAVNFWREDGLSARRVDVYPTLLHSIGTDYVATQMVGLRETAYSFYKGEDFGDSLHREAFEYQITGHTRLYKDYSSFTHVIEPSIGYHFISSSENDLPIFDVTDLFQQTSNIELSILNRILRKGQEILLFRISQALDTYNGSHPFLPLEFDLGMKSPFPLLISATYDTESGRIETLNSEVSFKVWKANLAFGESYARSEDVLMLTSTVSFNPVRQIGLAAQVWYDAKGAGLQDMSVTLKYMRQCWGLRLEAVKRPGDFSMRVLFDLAGLNSKVNKNEPPDYQKKYF